MLLVLLQRLLLRLLRGVVSRLGPAHQVQHLDLGDLVGVSGVCLPERDDKQKSFLIFPFFSAENNLPCCLPLLSVGQRRLYHHQEPDLFEVEAGRVREDGVPQGADVVGNVSIGVGGPGAGEG